ncbi:Uncharacterised protein [Moraxella catarrhalis]|nr:Uncharacterised protein [Moraxella catarrhalis]
MFDLLFGLLSCVGDDIAKTKSKKKATHHFINFWFFDIFSHLH